jgi:dTDP-4-amino-4,6-dideoxygalactose transaminase
MRDLSAHHLYILAIDFSKLSISRHELMVKLRSAGIGSQVHYRPIPTQPHYQALGFDDISIPNAMDYYSKCLSIPIHTKLKRSQQREICNTILELISGDASKNPIT